MVLSFFATMQAALQIKTLNTIRSLKGLGSSCFSNCVHSRGLTEGLLTQEGGKIKLRMVRGQANKTCGPSSASQDAGGFSICLCPTPLRTHILPCRVPLLQSLSSPLGPCPSVKASEEPAQLQALAGSRRPPERCHEPMPRNDGYVPTSLGQVEITSFPSNSYTICSFWLRSTIFKDSYFC